MFFKTKKHKNSIYELNRKVLDYKKWWESHSKEDGTPDGKRKNSYSSKVRNIDDSFVYYEEN